MRRLVGQLEGQLQKLLVDDQRAQEVVRLQKAYEQALKQQDTLQAHIRRLESERAEAETRMAELRKTYQEEQDVRKTREAELIRLQRLTAALQEDLSTLRQEFSQTRTALSQARAEGQKWQVRYAEVVEAQKALQDELQHRIAEAKRKQLEAQAASHPQAPAQERAEDIAALEQGLEQMRKTQQESLTRLQELRQVQEDELTRTRQETTQLQMQLAAAQQQIQTSRAESLQWQEQHRAASQALTTVRAELEATRAQHDALLTQLRQQSEELAQVHQEAETAKKQRATVQERVPNGTPSIRRRLKRWQLFKRNYRGSGSKRQPDPSDKNWKHRWRSKRQSSRRCSRSCCICRNGPPAPRRRVNSGKLDRPLPCKT